MIRTYIITESTINALRTKAHKFLDLVNAHSSTFIGQPELINIHFNGDYTTCLYRDYSCHIILEIAPSQEKEFEGLYESVIAPPPQ